MKIHGLTVSSRPGFSFRTETVFWPYAESWLRYRNCNMRLYRSCACMFSSLMCFICYRRAPIFSAFVRSGFCLLVVSCRRSWTRSPFLAFCYLAFWSSTSRSLEPTDQYGNTISLPLVTVSVTFGGLQPFRDSRSLPPEL